MGEAFTLPVSGVPLLSVPIVNVNVLLDGFQEIVELVKVRVPEVLVP
jgi:hypothetical protein